MTTQYPFYRKSNNLDLNLEKMLWFKKLNKYLLKYFKGSLYVKIAQIKLNKVLQGKNYDLIKKKSL